MLDVLVAGDACLLLDRDRVDVLRLRVERLGHAVHACVLDLLVDQEGRTLAAFGSQDALQGVEPFMGFLGIGVVGAGCAENLLGYGGHDCLLVNSCSGPWPFGRQAPG